MLSGLSHLAAYMRFLDLPLQSRRIVVYSEGADSWPHLGPLIKALLPRLQGELAYVSSSANDPGVSFKHSKLHSYVIGDGLVRSMFFNGLDADLALMTMPDLHCFHIKRSANTRCFVYLHHSLVSSHMAYRKHAFDYFDAILCAGPHHEAEIHAIEEADKLPKKALIRHGYGRIDDILAMSNEDLRSTQLLTVIVAPSWGQQGLIEAHLVTLLRGLEGCPWEVIIRPHPQTCRLAPQAVERLRSWCKQDKSKRKLEVGGSGQNSLRRSHLMISDWSGAAFDYALGLERPVLFVDVPRKINNPTFERYGLDPIEVFGRPYIGRVIAIDELATSLQSQVEALHTDSTNYVNPIRSFRERWVFNVGSSAEVGAEALLKLLKT